MCQREGERVLRHEHQLAPSGEELVPPSTLMAPTLLVAFSEVGNWKKRNKHHMDWESALSPRVLPGEDLLPLPCGRLPECSLGCSARLVTGALAVPVSHRRGEAERLSDTGGIPGEGWNLPRMLCACFPGLYFVSASVKDEPQNQRTLQTRLTRGLGSVPSTAWPPTDPVSKQQMGLGVKRTPTSAWWHAGLVSCPCGSDGRGATTRH